MLGPCLLLIYLDLLDSFRVSLLNLLVSHQSVFFDLPVCFKLLESIVLGLLLHERLCFVHLIVMRLLELFHIPLLIMCMSLENRFELFFLLFFLNFAIQFHLNLPSRTIFLLRCDSLGC